MFAMREIRNLTNNALATVPLFIIMGEVLFRSGAMEAVFDALDRNNVNVGGGSIDDELKA